MESHLTPLLILVASTNKNLVETIKLEAPRPLFETVVTQDSEEALALMRRSRFDFGFVDIDMCVDEGGLLVRALHEEFPALLLVGVIGQACSDAFDTKAAEGVTASVCVGARREHIRITMRVLCGHRFLTQKVKAAEHEREAFSHQFAGTMLNSLEALILGMAKLVEFRDADTGGHLERMSQISGVLGRSLIGHPKHHGHVTETYVEHLVRSAPLHDIGKIGVPDYILTKPGRLSHEEFEIIKFHPLIGWETLRGITQRVDDSSLFRMGLAITRYHHERWDGQGYPEGLTGERIPLSARIVAVADVFDALTSTRPYKKPFTFEKAASIIAEGKGTQFDPDVVDAFMQNTSEIREMAGQWRSEHKHDGVAETFGAVREQTPAFNTDLHKPYGGDPLGATLTETLEMSAKMPTGVHRYLTLPSVQKRHKADS